MEHTQKMLLNVTAQIGSQCFYTFIQLEKEDNNQYDFISTAWIIHTLMVMFT